MWRHLRQSLDSVYAQDDWHVSSKLTLNLGMRWEYGSPYSEQHGYVSNFDPNTQTVLTTTPGSAGITGVTPVSAGGTYGRTLINPDLNDFAPRVGFAYAPTMKTAIRGGFGTSYVHYTRAGSGDILGINAPQAQFASVTQIAPTTTDHCSPLPGADYRDGQDDAELLCDRGPGLPFCAGDGVQPRNGQHYVGTEEHARQLCRELLSERTGAVGEEHAARCGVCREPWAEAAGVCERHTRRTRRWDLRGPFANWPSDITEALNEFSSNYNALQVRYEQRFVGGLTLLNSFTWEHSLDNASASLEGNTPAPQDGNNLAGDYAQSDYNLPIANVTSLVYELPFGHGRKYLSSSKGFTDSLLGGWQVSLINTAQAGNAVQHHVHAELEECGESADLSELPWSE